jgi:hypothetical protein
VVTPNVGARVVLGPQLVEQPYPFHLALPLLRQAPARPSAVEIAVNVQREQIARLIARAPSGRRHHLANAERFQIKRIDTRLNETPWVIGSDIIIKPWWALDRFVAVRAWDMAHSGPQRHNRHQSNECPLICQIPEF